MQSLSITDQYASNDPQTMLAKRIDFCMQVRNDAVKALTYPPDEKKDLGEFGKFEEDQNEL